MKKLTLLIATILGISFASIAQENNKVEHNKKKPRHSKKEYVNQSPEQLADKMTNRLDEKLKFTDAQKKEIYAFNLKKAKDQIQQIEVRKKEMQTRRLAMKAERENLFKLLTPEQQELMKNKVADGKKNRFNDRDQSRRKKNIDRKEKSNDLMIEENSIKS